MGTSQPIGWRLGMMMVFLLTLLSSGMCDTDRDFKMCGTWRHGNGSLTLTYDLKKGCEGINISANESALSVRGRITGQCEEVGAELLGPGSGSMETGFCVFWEPLLDQLNLEVEGRNHTVCRPSGLYDKCCTGLTHGPNLQRHTYGILNATVHDDPISSSTMSAYAFYGEETSCKEKLCREASQGLERVNVIEESVIRSHINGSFDLPCVRGAVLDMKEDFQGHNASLPAMLDLAPEKTPTIHLPSVLKGTGSSKVVYTFFPNSFVFKKHSGEDQNDIWIIEQVVGITVENRVVSNLPEPVIIGFHHDIIPANYTRKCVSWDTKRDSSVVHWREDGCRTLEKDPATTECHCNHLTYFTILMEVRLQPVRHLLALSIITSLGCATSVFSCLGVLVFLNKPRRAKETSTPVHRGLAMSLFLLNLFFFFTGTLANLGGTEVCKVLGAALHYSFLSSFCWMALEVFHTYWLVYKVFSPSPKSYTKYLIGFGLPAIPVLVLVAMGNIYVVREVTPMDDINNPYLMCWMGISDAALLAHYLTNLVFPALVVLSGLVMLFLALEHIQNRDEWRKNRVRFLSIWGLSCLFGTTWGLGALNFGPLSDIIQFLFCILNSFQGFLLMLRFYFLERLGKKTDNSIEGSSTGSTRQHMLQEKT